MSRYVVLREADGEEDGDTVHHHHTYHHHHHGKGDSHHGSDSKYSDSIGAVMEDLEDHPPEWSAYGKTHPELMQIVGMEWAQLQAAKNNADHKKILEGLEELAAACIHAHKNM